MWRSLTGTSSSRRLGAALGAASAAAYALCEAPPPATAPTSASSSSGVGGADWEWVPAARFAPERLAASVTSCFALLVFLPPAAAAAAAAGGDNDAAAPSSSSSSSSSLLAPARAARGLSHAFRLGGAREAARDAEVTSYRALRALVPRALLVVSPRGGLEVPGGRRERGEAPHACAQRELEEETGHALAPPLAPAEAALALVRRRAARPQQGQEQQRSEEQLPSLPDEAEAAAEERVPRWLAFVRVTRDEREFDRAVTAFASGGGGASGRHGYPTESWGSAGLPLFIEGARGGAPRALALMAPRMQEMLLALLRHARVLSAAEAAQLRAAGDEAWRLARDARDMGDNEHAAPRAAPPPQPQPTQPSQQVTPSTRAV